MRRTTSLCVLSVVACVLVSSKNNVGQAALFVDTFESGTAGNNIGSPWGKNDITVTKYGSASNPFSSGSVYADVVDPTNSSSPSVAVRLLSHGNSDNSLSPSVQAQVTTYSFDFWEPSRTGDSGSVVFGYYHQNSNVDLNSAGRDYSATLHDGVLSPQSGVTGSNTPLNYSLEKVNTVFMIANDTASALTNYLGTGRNLAPITADVWISLDGAAPVYAFSVNRQNPTMTMAGVGFRTNNADVERVLVDNVLLVSGASFDRSDLTAVPEPAAFAFLAFCGTIALAVRKCKWLE